ncbi:MAG: hypothetical protein ACD_33C00023G0004 [uncultured bacterium]|nr:MAG: hypothetical protein ACD_33C00023G0004 [uncultured bacterium]
MLKEFIAKMPIDIITKTKIYNNKVIIPMKIDNTSFYNDHKTAIKDITFTTEKAIFIASKHNTNNKIKTSIDLLNSKIRF